eukprot:scaffold3498_cov112-Isochrysis_galbana.AAC.3
MCAASAMRPGSKAASPRGAVRIPRRPGESCRVARLPPRGNGSCSRRTDRPTSSDAGACAGRGRRGSREQR